MIKLGPFKFIYEFHGELIIFSNFMEKLNETKTFET